MELAVTSSDHAYRPDIDGLRAFAVCIVILFHAWPAWIPFGFTGVDIFFVISGYLITGILLREGFSFKSFYQRRILRILPPLLAVLLAAICLGALFLTPEEYARLGAHIRSASLFSANFHLLEEEGYFDIEASRKPLLHLWSLAVEEQFYIVYPVLLLIAAKFSRPLFGILVIMALSLTCAAYLEGTSAFYSPLSRAFELGCGAVAAVVPASRKYSGIAVSGGFALLIAGMAASAGHAGWPNLWTIPLCSGTALLLWGGLDRGFFRYVFANRLIVFIGLISYEFYLWHWLFLSLGHNFTSHGIRYAAKSVLILLALLVSIICYFCIEKPIRARFRNNWRAAALLLSGLALVGIAGHVLLALQGVPQRVGDKYLDTAAFSEMGARHFPDWKKYSDGNHVMLEAEPGRLAIAIMGDSHAQKLFSGIHEALAEMGNKEKIGVFPVSGGAPWPGIATLTEGLSNYRKESYKLILQAYRAIVDNPGIHTVILAHNPDCSYNDILDPDNPGRTGRDELMETAMRQGLTMLKNAGKNVIIVLDNPHFPFVPDTRRPLAKFILGETAMIPRKKDVSLQWYENISRKLAKDFENVRIVDLYDVFCENGFCKAVIDGKVRYQDMDHLNPSGALLAARHIIRKAPEFFDLPDAP